MAQWSGKTKGNLSGYKIFVFVIKHIGVRPAYFLLRFVAFYFLLFSRQKSLKYYFTQIHKQKKSKALLSMYKNYFMLGQVLIDKIAFMSEGKNTFDFVYEGEENLHKIVQNKTGGVLIGAHMGNWEIAGQLFSRINQKVNIVMLEAEHATIKKYLDGVLKEKQLNIIAIKNDFSHLVKIQKAFDNKELIAIHSDRFLPNSTTVVVDLMGKKAQLPTGPIYLAAKNKIPVSFVYTMKESAKKYHFYATPAKMFKYPANLKTRKQDLQKMVQEYADSLTEMIKKYPYQWFNYHPFWENDPLQSVNKK